MAVVVVVVVEKEQGREKWDGDISKERLRGNKKKKGLRRMRRRNWKEFKVVGDVLFFYFIFLLALSFRGEDKRT